MLASSISIKRLGPNYFVITGVINGVTKTIPLDEIMLHSVIIRATESIDAPHPNENGLRVRKNDRA